jgi:hypothetical protein
MTWGAFWIDVGSTFGYVLLAFAFHAFVLYLGTIIKS